MMIKLAERLRDMRMAYTLPRDRQVDLALETRDLMCYIALKFGLYQVKVTLPVGGSPGECCLQSVVGQEIADKQTN